MARKTRAQKDAAKARLEQQGGLQPSISTEKSVHPAGTQSSKKQQKSTQERNEILQQIPKQQVEQQNTALRQNTSHQQNNAQQQTKPRKRNNLRNARKEAASPFRNKPRKTFDAIKPKSRVSVPKTPSFASAADPTWPAPKQSAHEWTAKGAQQIRREFQQAREEERLAGYAGQEIDMSPCRCPDADNDDYDSDYE